jgi:DNA mismatch endonuclease (patch repair protein)
LGLTDFPRHWPVFGKPDFVFPKLRLAVFVDGCFWHGCPRHGVKPRQNAAFWRRKIAANRTRDRLVNRTLRKMGWRVLRVWEHELARRNESRLLRRLLAMLSAASDR